MQQKFIYQKGLKRGYLTLIEKSHSYKRSTYWKMQCDCGNIITRPQHLFYRSKVPSCGCYLKLSGPTSQYWRGYKDISGNKFNHIKWTAKERNLSFDVTIQDIWNQYLKQDKKCAYLGITVKFDTRKRKVNSTASVDRIDSSKGYTPNNIQIVHKIINFMKWDKSEKEFLEMISNIHYYQQN